jgi:hypothetical protein
MSNLTKKDLTLVKQLTLMFSQIEDQIEVPRGGHENYSHSRIFAERVIDAMISLYQSNDSFFNRVDANGQSLSMKFDEIDFGRMQSDQLYANQCEYTLSAGQRCLEVERIFNPDELIKAFKNIFGMDYVPISERDIKPKSPPALSTIEEFAKSIKNSAQFIRSCELRGVDQTKELKKIVEAEELRRRDDLQARAIQNR